MKLNAKIIGSRWRHKSTPSVVLQIDSIMVFKTYTSRYATRWTYIVLEAGQLDVYGTGEVGTSTPASIRASFRRIAE